jgi:non-heme chloroperoxidase
LTGGGEVGHHQRHGEAQVAKAAILCAVPPLMLKTAPIRTDSQKVFDDFQLTSRPIVAILSRRGAGPLYGYNRQGPASEPVIQNWWRQGSDGRLEGTLR